MLTRTDGRACRLSAGEGSGVSSASVSAQMALIGNHRLVIGEEHGASPGKPSGSER
jgi:hypothetical protein